MNPTIRHVFFWKLIIALAILPCFLLVSIIKLFRSMIKAIELFFDLAELSPAPSALVPSIESFRSLVSSLLMFLPEVREVPSFNFFDLKGATRSGTIRLDGCPTAPRPLCPIRPRPRTHLPFGGSGSAETLQLPFEEVLDTRQYQPELKWVKAYIDDIVIGS